MLCILCANGVGTPFDARGGGIAYWVYPTRRGFYPIYEPTFILEIPFSKFLVRASTTVLGAILINSF